MCIRDSLNGLIVDNPALHELDFTGDGFQWVDCQNAEDSTLVFLRKAQSGDAPVLICCNFTPVVRYDYRVGVPKAGFWRELFNSDSVIYGGSNVGNYPGATSLGEANHGLEDSISIVMPPLAVMVFRWES